MRTEGPKYEFDSAAGGTEAYIDSCYWLVYTGRSFCLCFPKG